MMFSRYVDWSRCRSSVLSLSLPRRWSRRAASIRNAPASRSLIERRRTPVRRRSTSSRSWRRSSASASPAATRRSAQVARSAVSDGSRSACAVNGIRGRMPQVGSVNAAITGAVRSDYGVDDQVMGLPAVEGALGLFGGIPLGLTRAFAVDALVSATYVPELSASNVALSLPDGSLKLGFGARVGLLQESFATPSVSLTYLKRDLPKASIVASSGNDRFPSNDIDVKTTAWRAVAGKSLGFFGLAIGGGQDKYDSRATGAVEVNEAGFNVTGGPYDLSQKVSRTNIFVDASLNLPFVKFAGEIGRVSGGTIDTYNTFSGKRRTMRSRTHRSGCASATNKLGSVGVRSGLCP